MMMKIRSENTILYASIFFALAFWLIEALVDTVFFYDTTFLEALVDVPAHEVYYRVVVSVLIVAFGYFASATSRRLRAAEEARSGSEELYRTLFENTPLGLGIADTNGNLIDFNDGMLRPGKYTREDIERIGNVARLYYNPADRDRLLGKAAREGELYREEVQFVRKDGTPYDALLSLTRVQVDGRPCWQALVEDVTDRKRAEAELIRAQRFRAIAELAAGISHNLNNMLVGVLGPLDLIEESHDDPKLLKWVKVIRSSGERARDLVRRLNDSVRGESETDLSPVEVNNVVTQALEMCRPRWKDELEAQGVTIRPEIVLEARRPARGTEYSLHEIMVNLIFNAVDAMPEGGTLAVRTGDADGHVCITVSDTGVGMDQQTLDRIFEPFYTTKMDVGTGLGLSTVQSIVKRWGGEIEAESKPGEGSTFTIRLPVHAESTEPAAEEESETGSAGGSRIMVLDDDEVVRDTLSSLLSDHDVVAFEDGESALGEFRAGDYRVALIDQGMSGLPGDQVARRMREMDACLVTVLVTGWDISEGDDRLAPFDFHIPKPPRRARILDVVRQAVTLYEERAGRIGSEPGPERVS